MPLEKLTKTRILAAFQRLSELAAKEGVCLEMTIYGGVAMMLAFNSRQATKDVDAIVKPTEVAERLARQVAREQGLHEGWLNDDVRQFISHRDHGARRALLLKEATFSHLKLVQPTAKYLLAMKVMAGRKPLPGYEGDFSDIAFLVKKMELKSVDDVQKIVDSFFPDSPMTEVTRATISEMLDKTWDHPK